MAGLLWVNSRDPGFADCRRGLSSGRVATRHLARSVARSVWGHAVFKASDGRLKDRAWDIPVVNMRLRERRVSAEAAVLGP